MKMKKYFGLLILGLALMTLAACGPKTPEDIVKTELKDSYTGYSQEDSYEHAPFEHGGSTLVFDKKKRTISDSNNERMFFAVLSDEQVKKIPSGFKGGLISLEEQLKGTENFTIAVGDAGIPSNSEQAVAYYQVALSEGGKKIRVIELRRGYKEDDAYYDFSGKVD